MSTRRPSPNPGPVARARRLLAAATGDAAVDPVTGAGLAAALDRCSAPTRIVVRGGPGTGRGTVARALGRRIAAEVVVEDLDEIAGPLSTGPAPLPGPAPDVEVLCLCTAPCAHEERWIARPRPHALVVVATHPDLWGGEVPGWASGLTAVNARDDDDEGLDALVHAVEAAALRTPALRERRFARDLEDLALVADPDLVESVLCGPGAGS